MILNKNIKLNSEEEWHKYITSIIKKARGKKRLNGEKAIEELKHSVLQGFDEILPKRFILLFSGGIDSVLISLIAKRTERDFLCITGGFGGSHDIKLAKEIAREYGLEIEVIYFNNNKLLEGLKETKRITQKSDIVSIEVGTVFYLLLNGSKKAKEYDFIASGLGAEELFAGYQKYADSLNPEEACIKGLMNSFKKDIQRDEPLISAFSKEGIFPFLHPKIIETSLRIPIEFKLKNGYKKYCLREVAQKLGLKQEWAFERKKAAQYGSNLDKETSRLSKKKGFKKKGDFLRTL
jgi:asparagine synthetase B (glutamine-hydrolysing)